MLDGYVHPDFSEVARVLARQIPAHRRRSAPGGAAVCVWHRGEVVVDCWGGTRDDAGRRWESDTLALSYSTTKGVTATLLHVLADRGLVDYDAPVRAYWPEFGEAGKSELQTTARGLFRQLDPEGRRLGEHHPARSGAVQRTAVATRCSIGRSSLGRHRALRKCSVARPIAGSVPIVDLQ